MKVIIIVAFACLALVGWTARAMDSPITIDFKDVKDSIVELVRHRNPGERAGFVRGLGETLSAKSPPGYSFMVYNMNQGFWKQLYDVQFFEKINEYNVNWGLWIFKCGEFKNEGDRGWQNWAYGGHFTNFDNGNGVRFLNTDCPNQEYNH